MKRCISIILMLIITLSFPVSAYAAKPSGGDKIFKATLSITPSSATVNTNQSIALTAAWSATLGINRTQWYVDGTPIDSSLMTFRRDTTKGQSTYVFSSSVAGQHTVKFRIWKEGDSSRDAASVVIVNVNSQTTTEIRYVSLGDSIATGTTTPLSPDTNPYTDQLKTYLGKNGSVNVIRSEFEVDGDRTNELYDKLGLGNLSSSATEDPALIEAIRNADVITLSIGGNNLMQACKTGIWLSPYDFFNPDVALANQGYSDFINQFDDIMERIDQLDKEGAVVIVMTLYNPYNLSDTNMHNLVDGYYIGSSSDTSDGMNDQINGLAGTYDYRVADVFTEFDKYNTNMGAVTLLYPSSLIRNPHPNQNGQNLIRDLHIAQYDFAN